MLIGLWHRGTFREVPGNAESIVRCSTVTNNREQRLVLTRSRRGLIQARRAPLCVGLAALAVTLAFGGCTQPSTEVAATRHEVYFSKKLLLVGPHQEAGVADFNQDGVLDIVSGAYWFAGPEYAPRAFRANAASADFVRSNSALPYDVDGDGRMDVIIGAWDEAGVMWYRNPGDFGLRRGLT